MSVWGGHDVREFTCDSLLSNISMVFQNVYLFHDTVRNNICFGKPDATEEETIEQADQILVVDDGRVVQCGTHQELVKVPGKYRDFVDIRKRSEGWQLTG